MTSFDIQLRNTSTGSPVLGRRRPTCSPAFKSQSSHVLEPRQRLGTAQGGLDLSRGVHELAAPRVTRRDGDGKCDTHKLLAVVLCLGLGILTGCQSRSL